MAVAMSSFLQGSVTVMSSFAKRDLNMTTAEVTWMTASSALSSGALLLFFGSVADLFGRKAMFIGSMILFSAFALGAGFSNSGLTLDILNGVMGIFSASCVPPAQGMLGTIYAKPSKRKNKAFGCFNSGNPLGFVFGTILSGLATQLFGWRASFWWLAIVYATVTLVAIFTVPKDTATKVPFNEETLKRLDLPGTALTILGIGMFCAALSLGGEAANGWTTPYVLVFLILGVLLIAAFIVWELKYPYAMIDMSIWKDRDFSLLILALCFGFLGFPILSFWLALYFQEVLGYSALMTGVHMLPMVVVGLAANIVAALVLHKVSNKLLMGIGALAFMFSFILAAAQRYGDSYWAFSFPALCLCVIGADFQFNVGNMYVVSSMPSNRQSMAGSIFQTLTRLCTAVGMGISTSIFNSVERNPATSGYYANNAFEPYAATFWFSAGVAFVGTLFIPFLTIGTQGHKGDKGRVRDSVESQLDEDFDHAKRAGAGEKETVQSTDVEKTA
ncbi:MFS general substrate transporter [Amniculicola lignicola CBS 123094]|uniref:MFS general substrate transporter n=1 Tax=Amniculicola lignicola CBS 123094 TaxID=1392246 RepID=A0A6A5WLT4_9PLEO|nr:MFS general substrate transporter [Amniculicola lignicola CBS 123094]